MILILQLTNWKWRILGETIQVWTTRYMKLKYCQNVDCVSHASQLALWAEIYRAAAVWCSGWPLETMWAISILAQRKNPTRENQIGTGLSDLHYLLSTIFNPKKIAAMKRILKRIRWMDSLFIYLLCYNIVSHFQINDCIIY